MQSRPHHAEVIRQFTSQAAPFAECVAHHSNESLEVFRELGNLRGGERILDAGCGPGIVSRFLARHVASVVGVDLTPAMVETASRLARDESLTNVTFATADMTDLPFAAGTFDATVSRYAFHHLEDPAAALVEMRRVTRGNGMIIVVDVAPPAAKRDRYDAFERRRDASHTSALTLEEWMALGESADLGKVTIRRFGLSMPAESLLASSFPNQDPRVDLVEILRTDLGADALGFSVRMVEDALTVVFPVAAFAWTLPSDG